MFFPLPKDFKGYKEGDSVSLKNDGHTRGYIRGVYVLPDGRRVYLVLGASAEVPNLRAGFSPWIQTLTDEDLNPPRVSWNALPEAAMYVSVLSRFCLLVCVSDIYFSSRWWLRYDLSCPDYVTGYWPVPKNGWEVGHYVSIQTFALVKTVPRVLAKIVFISPRKEYVTVVLPRDTKDEVNPDQVYPYKIRMEHLVGPHIGGQDLSKVEWPAAYDRPVSPLDLGAGAIEPESVGKRDRVLSDPLTFAQPVKVRKIEHGEQAEPGEEEDVPDDEAVPDGEDVQEDKAEPEAKHDEAEMDVSCYFVDA